MNKLIDYRLYDPTNSLFGNKRDRAKFTTLYCSMADKCPVYARGCCTVWHGVGGTRCPYGQRKIETGFTPRAKRFGTWINEKREKVTHIKQLGSWDKIAMIGDYVFFPYPYWSIEMRGLDQKYQHGAFRNPDKFLPKKIFTIDLFEKIVNARPRAMMGGEIRTYQKETVNMIIMHTREELPEFYNEWAAKYPGTSGRFETVNHVGRKAYLKTVKKGSVFPHDRGGMVWDGVNLVVDDYTSVFLPIKPQKATLIMLPDDDSVVEITDNAQVTEDTKFLS